MIAPTPSNHIVLGVDTSLRSTGIGIVKAVGNKRVALYYGPIKTSSTKPMSEALRNLQASLEELIETYQPTEAALEGVFFAKNVKTAMILCHARGVVVATCAKHGIPICEYSPSEIKRATTGAGLADKSRVQAMMARLLSLPLPIQNDAADALAIAVTHLNRTSGILALQPHTL